MSYASAVTPATSSAAASAAQSYIDPVDVINDASGEPTQEIYPGAVDPGTYSGLQDEAPTTPGGPSGPLAGATPGQPFPGTLPGSPEGGGYQDLSWTTGHDGPQAPWDSNAGEPFAPSGAAPPELHGEDLGAVFIRQHVIPAAIGSLTRRTQEGQTTIRNGSGDQVIKDNVTSPNDRLDLDQYQYHNPDGYDPWVIPYGERPIQNNLAWEAQALQVSDAPYVPSGALPDRAPFDYAAQAYEAPPDPYVGAARASGDTGIGGGWV
jgi:hypothetical protein